MSTYVWCEDSGAGYMFWETFFRCLYPDYIVETKNGNSHLNKAIEHVKENENFYYVIIDTAADNPDVIRELNRLKRNADKKNNVRLIELNSFEFFLLSFEYLENWVFSEYDSLKEKRKDILKAKNRFVKIVKSGGDADDLAAFKSEYQMKKNTEKISAKLLFEITRNTGFETNKKQVGSCFVVDCCEWNERQNDDICGLDNSRISTYDKMNRILNHSVLKSVFEEAGL